MVLGPHRVLGPHTALGPHTVLVPHRVLGPPRILGPPRVLNPHRVLRPHRVLGPHKVLGPESSQGPGSRFSGMPRTCNKFFHVHVNVLTKDFFVRPYGYSMLTNEIYARPCDVFRALTTKIYKHVNWALRRKFSQSQY